MSSESSIFVVFFVLIALLILSIWAGRRQMRIIDTGHVLSFEGPTGPIVSAAANAMKGMMWTVSQQSDGLVTSHSSGSQLAVEFIDEGSVGVHFSSIRYQTQLGGIAKWPRSYRSIKRKRNKVMTAIATAASRNDWEVYQSLN